jgi:hypothetical protein
VICPQQAFVGGSDFSIYSGHDTTILAVLGLLGVKTLKDGIGFGSYLMLEVWDSTPPPIEARDDTQSVKSAVIDFGDPESHQLPCSWSPKPWTAPPPGGVDQRTLRVLLCSEPFYPPSTEVRPFSSVVLTELSVSDVHSRLGAIHGALSKAGIELPPLRFSPPPATESSLLSLMTFGLASTSVDLTFGLTS